MGVSIDDWYTTTFLREQPHNSWNRGQLNISCVKFKNHFEMGTHI